MLRLREWQTAALEVVLALDKALVDACPGAGKTTFAAEYVRRLFASGVIDGIIHVTPWASLKTAIVKDDYHPLRVAMQPNFPSRSDQFPSAYSGFVCTYAQLCTLVGVCRTWQRNGRRLAFIFDEIHHASENNTWGGVVEECGLFATRVLSMTGTAFRPDGTKMPSWLRYDPSGKVIADYTYGYDRAVADGVCRPVVFQYDDGVARFIDTWRDGDQITSALDERRVSETPEHLTSKVAATIFHHEADYLEEVIRRADAQLEEYRIDDPDAGCLIACRPGRDEDDDRYIHLVARRVQRVTGETPIIVTHDDQSADDKIEAFKTSRDKYIVAVRKISEGANIRRLRVGVMAMYTDSELLFRQLFGPGRVGRVEEDGPNHDATVFIGAFPRLKTFAERVRQEAEAGLRQKPAKGTGNGGTGTPTDGFTPLNATHEAGGASAMGTAFSAEEILAAERMKAQYPVLRTTSVAGIAFLLRHPHPGGPGESSEAEAPDFIIRKKRAANINRLTRQYALKAGVEFGVVFGKLFARLGVKDLDELRDRSPIEKLDQAIAILEAWLQKL